MPCLNDYCLKTEFLGGLEFSQKKMIDKVHVWIRTGKNRAVGISHTVDSFGCRSMRTAKFQWVQIIGKHSEVERNGLSKGRKYFANLCATRKS
jgi:hypothetical protein